MKVGEVCDKPISLLSESFLYKIQSRTEKAVLYKNLYIEIKLFCCKWGAYWNECIHSAQADHMEFRVENNKLRELYFPQVT